MKWQDLTQQDLTQQDLTQQDLTQQDLAQQDLAQQRLAQQGLAQQILAQSDRGTISASSRSSCCSDRRRHHTTGCAWPVCTLMKPSGACSHGATSTQLHGAQVKVANIRRSGNPGYQRGRNVGSYIQSTLRPSV